jgi:hypothetical protein
MAMGLSRVEPIAHKRLLVCLSIRAAWRRVPLELWDKYLAFISMTPAEGVPGLESPLQRWAASVRLLGLPLHVPQDFSRQFPEHGKQQSYPHLPYGLTSPSRP